MKKTLWILAFIVTACGSGPCHEKKVLTKAQTSEQEAAMNQTHPNDKIRIYKADGSLQCGMGKAIPLDEMKKELAGITVFSAENKADGLMHMQLCGSATGRCNVYEIDRSDLEKAKKMGFKEWTWD